ncbi:multiple inositol polyphosphate phosphatase 1a [Sardina pilchardus]|uniref:multiple inositol polyphosphate phosphatase 1a n=1 Tax=Sardina pilchardus TaxID=27697 RepID=UPI002E12F14E
MILKDPRVIFSAYLSFSLITCLTCCDIPRIATYFGTKGRYEEVNTYLINDKLAVNETLIRGASSTCSAVHLTAVIRHGTRYPTTKNVKKMKDFYNLVQSNAPDWSHKLNQSLWKMWYTEDMDGRLVQKGREDHTNLAKRLAKYFPTLITEENLRNGSIKFITSSKHRCVNSTIAFKTGLIEYFGIGGEEFDHEVNDALMRFFDACAKWVAEVEKNKLALKEVDLFNGTPEMKRTAEKLADRLQVPYSQLTADSVEGALYLCAYDFAIKSINSLWCQLFDEMDAKVIEYATDLKQFWKRSYGHEINSKSSCALFHDLFKRLDQAASDSRSGHVSEAVTIQVGHAETLLPLLTLLGLFKDIEPLTSTNFATQADRIFRAGRIVPYAANLVVVLYNCPEGFRLEARLNEKPLRLPKLDTDFPLFDDVKRNYAELLQGCNPKTECELTNV